MEIPRSEEIQRWSVDRKSTPTPTSAKIDVAGEIGQEKAEKPKSLEYKIEDTAGEMFVKIKMELDGGDNPKSALSMAEAGSLFSKELRAKAKEVKFSAEERRFIVQKMREAKAALYETGRTIMVPIDNNGDIQEAKFNLIVVLDEQDSTLKLNLEPQGELANKLLQLN